MTRWMLILLVGWSLAVLGKEPASRRVVDDTVYLERVVAGAAELRKQGKLRLVGELRRETRTRGVALKLPAPSREKRAGPALYERLAGSTLAVGEYYRCGECPEWHFNSGAGFVVAAGGVVCTCCHVLLGEKLDSPEAYLVAADVEGRVYPVAGVLAAEVDSDTCFVQLAGADALAPLPLAAGARVGERVYCLSHPGGYHFMFSEGIVARVARLRNERLDEQGRTNGWLTRPVLFLNVTAEFAPGSSGAPVVDEAGNVVAQVASIADAGEPPEGETNCAAWPSVPVRFCTAAEEILALTNPALEPSPPSAAPGGLAHREPAPRKQNELDPPGRPGRP